MKLPQKFIAIAGAATLCSAMLGAPAFSQDPPIMAMTTDIPDGITTPDNIETHLGDLSFFDGVPDEATTEKIYSLDDFSQAYQTYL